MKKPGSVVLIVLLAWSALILVQERARRPSALQEEGEGARLPGSENCLSCRRRSFPKKDAVTYNDRGKWLMAEKDKRKAKEVDVSWLKEYPGDKK